MKIFVSYINTHQKASFIPEEALNNQIDRMTLQVDISHSLPLATPVLAQWHNRCKNEVVLVAVMKVIHGPGHMCCVSLRLNQGNAP